jgi:hypothetical protein
MLPQTTSTVFGVELGAEVAGADVSDVQLDLAAGELGRDGRPGSHVGC